MRKVLAKLCHGGERRPREPLGPAAPLVRAVAWGIATLTCLGVLVLAGVYALAPRPGIVTAIVNVMATGFTVSGVIRFCAGFFRPGPLGLRATTRRLS